MPPKSNALAASQAAAAAAVNNSGGSNLNVATTAEAKTSGNQNITQQILNTDNAIAKLQAARQAALAMRTAAKQQDADNNAGDENADAMDELMQQLAFEHKLKKAKLFTYWRFMRSGTIIVQYLLSVFNACIEPANYTLWGLSFALDIIDMLDTIYQQRRDKIEYDMLDEAEKARRQAETVRELKHELLVLGYDSMTVAPVEIFAWFVPRESRMQVAAYLRLVRCLRVYKSFAVITAYEALASSSTLLVRNVYYLLFSVCVLHTCGCIWFAVACSYMAPGMHLPLCTRGSWILPNPGSADILYTLPTLFSTDNRWNVAFPDDGVNVTYALTDHFVGLKYWMSLYYSVGSLILVGYGDILPKNLAEITVTLFFVWFGGFGIIYNAILGGIASMLTNADVSRFAFKHRILAVMQHLQDQNATSALTQHTISYYEYLWKSKGGTLTEGLLQELPFALRAEIAMAVNGNVIDKSPLFNDLPESFLRAITLKVKAQQVLPDEIVMQRNVPSRSMMYIHRGELELLSDTADEAPIMVLHNGKLFGEINLITRLTRKYTIRAITHCDMMTITDEDLNELLGLYPEAMEDLILRTEERFGLEMPSLILRRNVALDNLPISDDGDAAVLKSTEDANELLYKARQLIKQTGEKLRPLLAALHLERPDKSLPLTPSINFFRIDDPILTLLEKANIASSQSVFQRMWTWLKTVEIDPHSSFARYWTTLIIILAFFITFAYPFINAFYPYKWLVENSTSVGVILITFTYLMDICLLIDVLLNFRKHIATPNGVIKDLKICRKIYMSTTLFKFDLLASFPLEILAPMVMADVKDFWYWYGMFKLNRIFKVYHLYEFIAAGMEGIDDSIARMRLYLIGFMILFVSHVCGCFMYITACPGGDCAHRPSSIPSNVVTSIIPGYKSSWVSEDWLRVRANGTDLGTWFDYVACFYFAVTTSTSTGYGDLWPRSVWGMLICIVTMLTGIMIYGFITGMVTATLANLDAPRVEFQGRMFGLRNFMNDNELSHALQQRAVLSFSILWVLNQGEYIPGVKNMIHDLPVDVTKDLYKDENKDLLSKGLLFRFLEDAFFRDIGVHAKRFVYFPGENLIEKKDQGREYQVIKHGVCKMFHPEREGVAIAELGPGQHCGDLGFLFSAMEPCTVKAESFVEAISFNRPECDKYFAERGWFSTQMKEITADIAYRDALLDRIKRAIPLSERQKKEEETRKTRRKRIHIDMAELNELDIGKLPEKSIDAIDEVTGEFSMEAIENDWVLIDMSNFLKRITKFYMSGLKPIHPTESFLRWWTPLRVGMAQIYILHTFAIPTFNIYHPFWEFIGYVFDLFCVADVIIGSHITYYSGPGVLVTHPYFTLRNYIYTNFFTDLISSFPIEIIPFFLGFPHIMNNGFFDVHWMRMSAYFRLNRMLQFVRVPAYFERLEEDILRDMAGLRMIKYLIYLLMYLLLMLCMPILFECEPSVCMFHKPPICYDRHIDLADTPRNFSVHSLRDTGNFVCDCIQSTFLNFTQGDIPSDRNFTLPVVSTIFDWDEASYLFVNAFYFASITANTVGYGDLYATNMFERVLFPFMMIAGNLFFNYLAAAIAASQANADSMRARLQEKMHIIKKFLRRENFDDTVLKRITDYYEYIWLRTGGIDTKSTFVGLPPGLGTEISYQLFREAIDKINFLAGAPIGLKKKVATIIRPVYLLPGEWLTRKGDIGNELFFINRGAVQVVSDDPVPIVFVPHIGEGSLLGEIAFVFNSPRTASLRTKSHTDIFRLLREDVDVLFRDFPELEATMTRIATERVEEDKKMASDPDAKKKRDEKQALEKAIWEGKKREIRQRKKERFQFLRKSDKFERLYTRTYSPTIKLLRYFTTAVNLVAYFSAYIMIWQAFMRDYHNQALTIISALFEIFFYLELILRLRLRFKDERGIEVSPYNAIQRHNLDPLLSWNSILYDMVAQFPIELCGFAYIGAPVDGAAEVLKWEETFYFLRLYHLIRFRRTINYFSKWKKELDINALGLGLIINLGFLALFVHFIACFWVFLACKVVCHRDSWVLKEDGSTRFEYIGHDSSLLRQYWVAFYWASAATTTVGYGDVLPTTLVEKLVCAVAVFIAKIIIGMIVGGISATLANAGSTSNAYHEKMKTVLVYLRDQNADDSVMQRVENYYHFLWERQNGAMEISSLYRDVPFCMLTELGYRVHEKELRAVELFADIKLTDSCVRMLSVYMQQVQFVGGDDVLKQFDKMREMFFIHKGSVEVIRMGLVVKEMHSGESFNWEAMLLDWPSQATYKCLDDCDFYILHRNDFMFVLDRFPDIKGRIDMARALLEDALAQHTEQERKRRIAEKYHSNE